MPDDAGELAPADDTLLVADLGLQGGSLSVHGKRSEQGWTFWGEGTTIALDENDEETWRSWASEPMADLARLLPADWPMFYPVGIDPRFRPWFRQAYEASRASLRPDLRLYHDEDLHRRWLGFL
jgi:hypothetical protein